MNKAFRKFIVLSLLLPSTLLVGCDGQNGESSILDQHVLFNGGFEVNNRVLTLNIKSCYELHSIKYQYTIFGENNKLIGVYDEEQNITIPKNKEISFTCLGEILDKVTLVRFKVLDGKTYDKVDNSYVIENKVFYYDYLALFNEDFKLQNTEKVMPKKFPKATFSAVDIGAYKFSYWSHDFYGNDSYAYDEVATKNIMLYPNYTFSEISYDEILKEDKCYNASFVINREFKSNETDEKQTLVGYGILYKKEGTECFGITSLSFLERELEGYTYTATNVHMKKDDYSFYILERYPEYNLATIRFDVPSSKRYYAGVFSASSYLHAKANTIGIIEPPYAASRKESVSVFGKYLGHEEIVEDEVTKDYLKYECSIGEGLEGTPIFDCQGNIAGINTDKYSNGVGYAISADTVREALNIFE